MPDGRENVSRTLFVVKTILAIFVCLFGVFATDIVQRLILPGAFRKSENLPFEAAAIAVIAFVIALYSTIALHRDVTNKTTTALNELNERLTALGHSVSRISEAVGPVLRVLPYEEASRLLMERIEAAETEVLVLSNYSRFDWDSGQPIKVDPARGNDNPERAKKYERTQNKLRQVRERVNFRFTKIIQIPKGGRLGDALSYDPVYAADCRFIVEGFPHAPGRVSLRVSEVIFQNTFTIVDRSFLWLEFDMGSHVDGRKGEPFVMTVEDPGHKFVTKLYNLFEHVYSVSKIQRLEDLGDGAKQNDKVASAER